MLLLPL
ncbi:hypothetical protein YPPY29_0882, partial [Yersinia pestis PY-29]